jgi:hypothetical protein
MAGSEQRTAQWLGYAGLLPFIGLALAVVADIQLPRVDPAIALAAYAALILSFLGGVSWGLAVAGPGPTATERRHLFLMSVLPALIGWAAVLLPFVTGIWILVLAFGGVYLHDRRVGARGHYPTWFMTLRRVLTSVAVACMVTAGLTV